MGLEFSVQGPQADPKFPPFLALVKAPSSYPNSSDLNKVSGMLAQLTGTKGPLDLAPEWWMALAKSPLPVPVSPVILSWPSLEKEVKVITPKAMVSVRIHGLGALFVICRHGICYICYKY
jgi:hypothetical protein